MKFLKNVILIVLSCIVSYWLVGGAFVDLFFRMKH